jgi:manganese efflux pump family protein
MFSILLDIKLRIFHTGPGSGNTSRYKGLLGRSADMNITEILLIAVALAMDAFAVSIAAGTSGWMKNARAKFRLSFHVGLFQFMMPVAGWYAGIHIAPLVSTIDHWVAFALLAFVGIRMIKESFDKDGQKIKKDPSRGFTLVLLALATSIDALAVGFSLAMIRIDIWYPSVIIGVVTSAISLIGIQLGHILGKVAGSRMEMIGGAILIIIGLRILLEGIFG